MLTDLGAGGRPATSIARGSRLTLRFFLLGSRLAHEFGLRRWCGRQRLVDGDLDVDARVQNATARRHLILPHVVVLLVLVLVLVLVVKAVGVFLPVGLTLILQRRNGA